LLSDQEIIRDFVVEAIATYGAEAAPYLPVLESLLADPKTGGTLPDALRAAILAIRNPAGRHPVRTIAVHLNEDALQTATFKSEYRPAGASQQSARSVDYDSSASTKVDKRIYIFAALLLFAGAMGWQLRRRHG